MITAMSLVIPAEAAIRAATGINLARLPATSAAQALVDAVVTRVMPHRDQVRPLGRKGLPTFRERVGRILGGIMGAGVARPVRAPRSYSAPMWQPGGVMGMDAFWGIVEAMKRAGLVEDRLGGARPMFESWEGVATAMWATEALAALAAECGVTAANRKLDWIAPVTATDVRVVPDDSLVSCRPEGGLPTWNSPAMLDLMDPMRQELRALNDLLSRTRIRGAGKSLAIRRLFLHSIALHGRFYADANGYQSLDGKARVRNITFDGEPVAEVDVKASTLTVLMGLTRHGLGPGGTLPYHDLYDIPGVGLPRATVKAWVIQTLGRGSAKWNRWGGDKLSGSPVKPKDVRAAVLPFYPFLGELIGLMPPDLAESLPAKLHGWAAGQYVIAKEAEIVAGAISYCVSQDIPVLPVHDSLIVPRSKAAVAQDALTGAFMTRGGVMPRLEVDYGT